MHAAGGTPVRLRLATPVALGQPAAAGCLFGDSAVQAAVVAADPSAGELVVECIAPAVAADAPSSVQVRVTLDGAAYTHRGPIFHYHAPFLLGRGAYAEEASGSGHAEERLLRLTVPLLVQGQRRELFGAHVPQGGVDSAKHLVAAAGCLIGNVWAPGTLHPERLEVSCYVSAEVLGTGEEVPLRVSLDGHRMSPDRLWWRYDDAVQELVLMRYDKALLQRPPYVPEHNRVPMLEALPFSPELCVPATAAMRRLVSLEVGGEEVRLQAMSEGANGSASVVLQSACMEQSPEGLFEVQVVASATAIPGGKLLIAGQPAHSGVPSVVCLSAGVHQILIELEGAASWEVVVYLLVDIPVLLFAMRGSAAPAPLASVQPLVAPPRTPGGRMQDAPRRIDLEEGAAEAADALAGARGATWRAPGSQDLVAGADAARADSAVLDLFAKAVSTHASLGQEGAGLSGTQEGLEEGQAIPGSREVDFYDPILLLPFYGSFYEADATFYAPEPGAPASQPGERAPTRTCIVGSTPVMGPDGGGTLVTLLLAGQAQRQGGVRVTCRFGEVVVPGAYVGSAGEEATVECVAPPRAPEAQRSVAVRLSLDDGRSFTAGGAPFHYHAPFHLAHVERGAATLGPDGRHGFDLTVTLSPTGGASTLLAPFLSLAAPDLDPGAACLYDGVWVPAEVRLDASRVVCHVPAPVLKTDALLRVTLDGQEASRDGLWLWHDAPARSLVAYDHAWDLPRAQRRRAVGEHSAPVEYLAFSPDLCTVHEAADAVALAALWLSAGEIHPAFDPEVHEYHTVMHAEEAPEMQVQVFAPPAEWRSSVDVAGHTVMPGRGVPVKLRVGANEVPIHVASRESRTVRSYVLSVYVLSELLAPGSLSHLSVVPGHLEPEFDATFPGPYTTVLPSTASRIYITAAALSGRGNVSSCAMATFREGAALQEVDGSGACVVAESGERSAALPVAAGVVTLVEVRALGPGGVEYELLVFRQPRHRSPPTPPPAPPPPPVRRLAPPPHPPVLPGRRRPLSAPSPMPQLRRLLRYEEHRLEDGASPPVSMPRRAPRLSSRQNALRSRYSPPRRARAMEGGMTAGRSHSPRVVFGAARLARGPLEYLGEAHTQGGADVGLHSAWVNKKRMCLVSARTPVAITASAAHQVITVFGDPAALPPISTPVETPLLAVVHYSDGSCADLSKDRRTRYTLIAGQEHAALPAEGGNVLVGVRAPGRVTVGVSFVEYPEARGLYAEVPVLVERMERLRIVPRQELPAVDGSRRPHIGPLRRIHCTAAFQRVTLHLRAELSHQGAIDVTSNSTFATDHPGAFEVRDGNGLVASAPGATNVRGTFAGATAELRIEASASERVWIRALRHATVWSELDARTFAAPWGAQRVLVVGAELADGSVVADVARDLAWIPLGALLAFSSSRPDKLAVDAHGVAALLGNHHRHVAITVAAACPTDDPAAPDVTVRTEQHVYANLEPGPGDLDLGHRVGLQLQPAQAQEAVFVDVRLHATPSACSAASLGFQARLHFDPEKLVAVHCSDAGSWPGQVECDLEVLGGARLSAAVPAAKGSTLTGVLHVVTLQLLALGGGGELALLRGDVRATCGNVVEEADSDTGAMVAGHGLMELVGLRDWADSEYEAYEEDSDYSSDDEEYGDFASVGSASVPPPPLVTRPADPPHSVPPSARLVSSDLPGFALEDFELEWPMAPPVDGCHIIDASRGAECMELDWSSRAPSPGVVPICKCACTGSFAIAAEAPRGNESAQLSHELVRSFKLEASELAGTVAMDVHVPRVSVDSLAARPTAVFPYRMVPRLAAATARYESDAHGITAGGYKPAHFFASMLPGAFQHDALSVRFAPPAPPAPVLPPPVAARVPLAKEVPAFAPLESRFYDFYGAEILFDLLYGELMYAPMIYEPFYGPMYDFYTNFYEPSLGDGLGMEGALAASAVPSPMLSLCIGGSAPTVGPATGGTHVMLQVTGHVMLHQSQIICRFGMESVEPVAKRALEVGTGLIECIAPPRPAYGAQTVAVRLSLDGVEFTYDGAPFHYHAPFSLSPAPRFSYTSSYEWQGVHAVFPLIPLDVYDQLFAPFLYRAGDVNVGAACLYGDTWVSGELSLQQEEVECHFAEHELEELQMVRVSLDGQTVTADSMWLRWDAEAQELAIHNHSWDQVPAPHSHAPAPELEFLPFSLDYCVQFTATDPAALAALEVSAGQLRPHFDPAVYIYHVVIQGGIVGADVWTLTPTAEDWGATVTVAGVEVLSGQAVHAPLRVGENVVAIQVTARRGQTSKTYVLHVYLLMDAASPGTLSLLALSHGTLDPAFDPDLVGPYSAVLEMNLRYLYIRAVSLLEGNISVCVTNARSQDRCQVVASGRWSHPISISAGVNLLEVEAVVHGVNSGLLYEVLAFRAAEFDEVDTGFAVATAEEDPNSPPPPPPPPLSGSCSVTPTSSFPDSSYTRQSPAGAPAYNRQPWVWIRSTSNTFIAAANPAEIITTVLRTSELYTDATDISVHYDLRDEDGRPQVDVASGLAVRMLLQLVDAEDELTVTCAVPSAATGAGDCADSGSGLGAWFSEDDSVDVEVHLSVLYSDTVVATSEVMDVVLHRKVAHTAVTSAGMLATFPVSPRFTGQTVTSDLTAHTGGYALVSWQVEVTYSTALFGASLAFTASSYYNTPEYNDATAGQITIGATGTSSGTADSDVTGTAVPILSLTMTVQSVTMSASQSSLTYADAFAVLVQDMINTGKNRFVGNVAAQVNDARGGAQTSGQFTVKRDTVVGMYAYPAVAELFNTAALSGTDVTSVITPTAVYNRYDKADAGLDSANCSLSTMQLTVATLNGCSFTVTSAHTEGSRGVDVAVQYDTLGVSVPMRVWFPQSTYISSEDSVLSQVSGLNSPTNCSLGEYQRTQLTATAAFGGTHLNDTEPLDVTCLVTFSSSEAGVVEIDGSAAQGQGAGTATISISSGGATLAPKNTSIEVLDSYVGVSKLDAVLLTGATWSGVADTSLSAGANMSVSVLLLHELRSEGAEGYITVYATFSDGTYREVKSTDGVQLTVADAYASSFAIATDSQGRFVGSVPVQAESLAATDVMQAAWIDGCTGATVSSGTGPVNVTLPDPISVSVTSEYSLITIEGDAAASSPISKPTASQLSVVMSYDDGTTKDLTEDSRTVYSITTAVDVLQMDGSTAKGNTAAGLGTVTVTFPTYKSAAGINGSVSLTVVLLESVTGAAHPYPSYSGSATISVTTLKQVQCTSSFQRAVMELTATLSDASTKVLAAIAVGSANLTGSFEGTHSAIVTVTVTETEVAQIASLAHQTSWTSGTFAAQQHTQQALSVTAVFDDGTQFPDVVSGVDWIAVSEYVDFASEASDKISVSSAGVATLLSNHYLAVSLSAAASCSTGAIAVLPSAVDAVYANLDPALGDVDLGARYGLQFPAASSGATLSVALRVNSGSAQLLDFQVLVTIQAQHMASSGCAQGADWAGLWTCTINDPAEEVLVLGSDASSAAQGSAVEVATITFDVGDAAVLTLVEGYVQVMTRSDNYPSGEKNYGVVAGQGYAQLNDGSSTRRRHLQQDGTASPTA
ncbi:hypothetical protein CYMTET_15264, partial [Cymbomonas tetramitiformis]